MKDAAPRNPSNALTVVLLSGGIESATLLHREHREGPVEALFVDYAQRAAECERTAAAAQCATLGLELHRLDLSAVGEAFRNGRAWQPHVPLPHRNLILLSLALSFATDRHAHRLCLALNREDAEAYPSGAPSFISDFRALAAGLSEIAVDAPLIALEKAAIIRLGNRLGVDYTHSYSCLLGRRRPCGGCPQCVKRRDAFAAAGLSDPALNPTEDAP
ncbi:7-cyano-7-deazaguanine synthase [Acidihalobacter prosperus]|uniref:7-cyano-7-deazaguanine synthase n=1 Tax=Acidihalobacter prosperus TaxID=160660 RepID=UPI0007EE946E|nr:7-cyano-7-deazaguanine synthase [Acidihalobacter prosperus]